MLPPMLGYVGPETVVPVASALASILGALLIGWRYIKLWCIRAIRCVVPGAFKGQEEDTPTDTPAGSAG